ncbi:Mob1/phocein [Saitoella complicata NRRL Y-17804]|nr:Mob1/phocein [Saitoella complicata NRRL Y-17804]ODQ51560.1 Mob1/phocein [Saitoella complicata NRRL Y-17804]
MPIDKKHPETTVMAAVDYRILPGTKSEVISLPEPVIPTTTDHLELQQYIDSLCVHTDTHSLTREKAMELIEVPEGLDVHEGVWCYEWMRRLCMDLNELVIALLEDGCEPTKCHLMNAGEYQFLCASHPRPRECSAIDYIHHTLTQSILLLLSPCFFDPSNPPSTHAFSSIARRLYRIFAHAWFEHHHVFWTVESETGVYKLFMAVSEKWRLVPVDLVILPKEAGEWTVEGDGEEVDEFDRGETVSGR